MRGRAGQPHGRRSVGGCGSGARGALPCQPWCGVWVWGMDCVLAAAVLGLVGLRVLGPEPPSPLTRRTCPADVSELQQGALVNFHQLMVDRHGATSATGGRPPSSLATGPEGPWLGPGVSGGRSSGGGSGGGGGGGGGSTGLGPSGPSAARGMHPPAPRAPAAAHGGTGHVGRAGSVGSGAAGPAGPTGSWSPGATGHDRGAGSADAARPAAAAASPASPSDPLQAYWKVSRAAAGAQHSSPAAATTAAAAAAAAAPAPLLAASAGVGAGEQPGGLQEQASDYPGAHAPAFGRGAGAGAGIGGGGGGSARLLGGRNPSWLRVSTAGWVDACGGLAKHGGQGPRRQAGWWAGAGAGAAHEDAALPASQ